MRVYPSRSLLATELFVSDILRCYDGKSTFVVDGALWPYKTAWKRLEHWRERMYEIGCLWRWHLLGTMILVAIDGSTVEAKRGRGDRGAMALSIRRAQRFTHE